MSTENPKPLRTAAKEARLGSLMVLVAAVTVANLWPLYLFAGNINEDEFWKTKWMVASSAATAATVAIYKVYKLWRDTKNTED